MSEEKKKYKNLFTYCVCMVLAVVILILFAAMADSRENQYESTISEQEKINVSIQNQIVGLSEENYRLKNEVTSLNETLTQKDNELTVVKEINQAWKLLAENKKEELNTKLTDLSSLSLTEEQQAEIQTIKNLMK